MSGFICNILNGGGHKMELILNNNSIQCEEPMTVLQFLASQNIDSDVYAITIDGKLHGLHDSIYHGGTVTLIHADSETGKQIYERSLNFLFIAAVHSLFKDVKVRMECALSKGQYCEIDFDGYIKPHDVRKIERKMKELVRENEPILRRVVSRKEAQEFFIKQDMVSKAKLIGCRKSNECSIYSLHGIHDYLYGIMLPNTSYLTHFSLKFQSPGIWLSTGTEYQKQPKLFQIFQEFENWGRLIGVSNVAQLNQKIQKGHMNELVLMSETMIEKKLSELAEKIVQKQDTRFILIAGPSSAGKTTFSRRLAIHLKILGKKPIPISMDDFFKDRKDCPKLPDGTYDFEGLGALDLDLFNDTMLKLLHNKDVEMPTFNFITGEREWKNKTIKMDKDTILIIEGIHGLNPKTYQDLPEQSIFRIYINALTHLNLDAHNRIPTSDYRLIRRIARDFQFRGYNAKDTIGLWKHVKAGEDQNIYPYQEEADAIFNTSMVYEMAILKGIVMPLLSEITPQEKEYLEANRLKSLLQYFVDGSAEAVPRNSILAEFIGNSLFDL